MHYSIEDFHKEYYCLDNGYRLRVYCHNDQMHDETMVS